MAELMIIQNGTSFKSMTTILADKTRLREIMVATMIARIRMNTEFIQPCKHCISITLDLRGAIIGHIKH